MTTQAVTAPPRIHLAIPGRDALFWPISALVLTLTLHFLIATQRAINWDEFWHYSQIHSQLAGQLRAPLQTLHASLFGWVPSLSGDSIDHLIVLRLVMLLCLAVTAGATMLVAEKFVGKTAGLFAALLYLSANFVIENGTSFRADPMAAAGLMASLALLVRGNLTTATTLAASLCAGFAAAVTIKSVLFAPAFAGIGWWFLATRPDTRDTVLKLAGFAVCALAGFAALYLWHSSGMADDSDAAAKGTVSRSWENMLGFGDLPYLWHNAMGAVSSPFFAFTLAAALVVLWHSRNLRPRAENIAIAGLIAPILSVFFYHNTAPYFHVFILPPVAAGSAIAVPLICRRYGARLFALLLAGSALTSWTMSERGVLENQQALVTAADAIFPQPVAYFDFPGMLGSYPKANGFLTVMGMRRYLSGNELSMIETMREQTVPLVIENEALLSDALRITGNDPMLFDEDVAALRENYVHFWGLFWLAGRDIDPADGEHATEFLVPGPYTVRNNPIAIDGLVYQPGDVVTIERASYVLSAPVGKARLLWGNQLEPPPYDSPKGRYWTPF